LLLIGGGVVISIVLTILYSIMYIDRALAFALMFIAILAM